MQPEICIRPRNGGNCGAASSPQRLTGLEKLTEVGLDIGLGSEMQFVLWQRPTNCRQTFAFPVHSQGRWKLTCQAVEQAPRGSASCENVLQGQ